jgi:hypothetical protein
VALGTTSGVNSYFKVDYFWDDGAQKTAITVSRPANGGSGLPLLSLAGGIIAGQDWCFKPGGGAWSNSDTELRTMFVIDDYVTGLDGILSLNPVIYRSRGNVTFNKDETSHRDTTTEYVGLVADSVETVMPEMVKRVAARIDDRPVSNLLTLDLSALPMAIVNAIKELHARVVALEAKG